MPHRLKTPIQSPWRAHDADAVTHQRMYEMRQFRQEVRLGPLITRNPVMTESARNLNKSFGMNHLELSEVAVKRIRPASEPAAVLRQRQIPFDLGWSWQELAVLRFLRAQLGTQLGHFEGTSDWFFMMLKDCKPLSEAGLEVVPGGGIEPSTHGFSVRCSTV